MEYEAQSNRMGVISGMCENGDVLSVKQGDFVFLEAPDWVKDIWKNVYPPAVMGG